MCLRWCCFCRLLEMYCQGHSTYSFDEVSMKRGIDVRDFPECETNEDHRKELTPKPELATIHA